MASPQSQNYTSTRITIQSPNTFDHVINKLYADIGGPDKAGVWPSIAQNITSFDEASKEKFEDEVNAAIGPHGFMIFVILDHGAWIPLYGVGDGLKVKRIILGNPLVAITMLKHDITGGLAVPVEILVRELEKDGRTEVLYNLPSGLIAGLDRREELQLVEAAEALDENLKALVEFICA